MDQVSTLRLWIMRAMYLVMALGIGANIWPLIVAHDPDVSRMTGVAWALLGTVGLLALVGIRYPVQMLPLLLFELTWKVIWLSAFALPRWMYGTLDDGMRESIFETSFGAVLLVVIPWSYVYANYIRKPAERSRPRQDRQAADTIAPEGAVA